VVLIALVAHRTLMRVRAHVSPEVLNAHDAHGALGRGANLIVHMISAADAAGGAGGKTVGVSGAHAYIVTHHPLGCKWVVEVYSNFFRGLHLAPPG
jgi:hypothetical protein